MTAITDDWIQNPINLRVLELHLAILARSGSRIQAETAGGSIASIERKSRQLDDLFGPPVQTRRGAELLEVTLDKAKDIALDIVHAAADQGFPYSQLVQDICQLAQADHSFLGILEHETGQFHITAESGDSDQRIRSVSRNDSSPSLVGWAANTKCPFVSGRFLTDEGEFNRASGWWCPTPEWHDGKRPESVLVVPIILDQQLDESRITLIPVGAIYVDATRQNAFSDQTLASLLLVARLLTKSIISHGHSRSISALLRAEKDRHAGKGASTSAEFLESAFGQILKNCHLATSGLICSIDNNQLRCISVAGSRFASELTASAVGTSGRGRIDISKVDERLNSGGVREESLTREAIRGKESVVWSLLRSQDSSSAGIEVFPGTVSTISCPITWGNESVGAITLESQAVYLRNGKISVWSPNVDPIESIKPWEWRQEPVVFLKNGNIATYLQRVSVYLASAMATVSNPASHEQPIERIPTGFFTGDGGKSESAYRNELNEKVSEIRKLGRAFPVLLIGENGSGKTMLAAEIARIIYPQNSNAERHLSGEAPENDDYEKRDAISQDNRRFFLLNLSLIPKDLVLGELFGWLKGSFTNAATDRDGFVKRAENGVLFLDEVQEIGPGAAEALQHLLFPPRTYYKLGAHKPEKTTAHIFMATSCASASDLAIRLGLPGLRSRLESHCTIIRTRSLREMCNGVAAVRRLCSRIISEKVAELYEYDPVAAERWFERLSRDGSSNESIQGRKSSSSARSCFQSVVVRFEEGSGGKIVAENGLTIVLSEAVITLLLERIKAGEFDGERGNTRRLSGLLIHGVARASTEVVAGKNWHSIVVRVNPEHIDGADEKRRAAKRG